eukprot:TRINITY_DN7744_c0_g1_i2.p1 TRINITY_DN7744_c0_g1~~TRINITY_DN7744_c0_g1_i2.p1  ORF type:complete len:513 (-),score=41.97 TRINITY_DN7744_c0_g1_i2:259-1797(-)
MCIRDSPNTCLKEEEMYDHGRRDSQERECSWISQIIGSSLLVLVMCLYLFDGGRILDWSEASLFIAVFLLIASLFAVLDGYDDLIIVRAASSIYRKLALLGIKIRFTSLKNSKRNGEPLCRIDYLWNATTIPFKKLASKVGYFGQEKIKDGSHDMNNHGVRSPWTISPLQHPRENGYHSRDSIMALSAQLPSRRLMNSGAMTQMHSYEVQDAMDAPESNGGITHRERTLSMSTSVHSTNASTPPILPRSHGNGVPLLVPEYWSSMILSNRRRRVLGRPRFEIFRKRRLYSSLIENETEAKKTSRKRKMTLDHKKGEENEFEVERGEFNKKFKSENAIEMIEEIDSDGEIAGEISKEEPETCQTESEYQKNGTNSTKGKKEKSCVLIADDTVYNLEVMKYYLKDTNLKLRLCFDGISALKIVLNRQRKMRPPFSLIMLNCNMPWKSGFKVAKELRRLMQRSVIKYCPIIGFSANPSLEFKIKRINAGMVDFLQLPYSQAELRGKVMHWLSLNP